MLPSGEVVKDVYLDPTSGVVAGVKVAAAGRPVKKLFVECGTIESATILEVGNAVDEARSGLPEGSAFGEYFTYTAPKHKEDISYRRVESS